MNLTGVHDQLLREPARAQLDFGKISDDYSKGFAQAMAGICVQAMIYETHWAAFDYFNYEDQNFSYI